MTIRNEHILTLMKLKRQKNGTENLLHSNKLFNVFLPSQTMVLRDAQTHYPYTRGRPDVIDVYKDTWSDNVWSTEVDGV